MTVNNKITNKNIKELLQWCQDYVNSVLNYIKLDYEITYVYNNKPYEENEKDSFCTVASIDIEHKYSKASVDIYPKTVDLWIKKDYNALRNVLCHEIAHIIIEPLYNLVNQNYKSPTEVETVSEQATEKIGRIIYSLYNKK